MINWGKCAWVCRYAVGKQEQSLGSTRPSLAATKGREGKEEAPAIRSGEARERAIKQQRPSRDEEREDN